MSVTILDDSNLSGKFQVIKEVAGEVGALDTGRTATTTGSTSAAHFQILILEENLRKCRINLVFKQRRGEKTRTLRLVCQ